MALMHRLNARAVVTLGTAKYNDGAGLLLHKRKDGGAQWTYRYTIHGCRREMGSGALRNISLKKARELATQWRSILQSNMFATPNLSQTEPTIDTKVLKNRNIKKNAQKYS